MDERPSILVVDDEPNNFDVIETLFTEEDYQLSYASSGKKALDRLEMLHPDVILLDVMMPDIDGIEVCRRIRANPHYHSTPIIMVTALTAKEDLARCLAVGADDFISKPVNGVELRARVRSMLRIKRQYDELQTLLTIRDDMVKMIVHDLRNPLSSILLSSEMLLLPNSTPESQIKRVNRIIVAGQSLQSLVDSLLIMAKLESGNIVLNLGETDLSALCKSAIDDLYEGAAHKGIQLSTKLPEATVRANIDKSIFRRVIDNLLSNAIKFSHKNSQVVLQVDCLEDQGIQIQVTDTGQGISENLRQQIFEKYEVGTLIKGVPQIGLGLAFCKMAVEAHGGAIAITDNHPQGSIFTIFLPNSVELQTQ